MGGDALAAWATEVERPDGEIGLARAALALARLEYPGLDAAPYLARLDRLAAAVLASANGDAVERLHRAREHLFAEVGFRGNRTDYFDPRNSFLNDVLDRRLGIPITLSLVLIEVGRRLGLPMYGVGLPGHFVTGVRLGETPILLDAFDGGTLLTQEACGRLVARVLGKAAVLTEAHFAPVTHRQLLARMLANLKTIYWQREDWPRVVGVCDRALRLDPDAAIERRDRGLALACMGELRRGAADWEQYLARCPGAADAADVRARLRQVREGLARLN